MTGAHIPAALRREIEARAQGRCEYCLMPASAAFIPHQVDHIVARKHGGQATANNLALSCALCNKHKGTDLASLDPDTDELTPLYHPRTADWSEHFRLNGATIEPLTATGRATVRLLQLNRPERLVERELLIAAGVLTIPS